MRWLAVVLALLIPLGARAQLGPGLTIGSLTIPNDNLHLGNWTQAGYEFSTPVAGGAPVTTGALWPIIQATAANGTCTGIATGNTAAQNLTQLQCEVNFASGLFGDGRTGTVVHVPAGTYQLGNNNGNGLDMPSNVVLKGDGPSSAPTSFLVLQGFESICNTGGVINWKPNSNGNAYTVTGGATQGSTVLNLSATYTDAIGAWVLVTENWDPLKVTNGQSNACQGSPPTSCFEHHHAKVIATSGTGSGTTITLDRPLRDNYTSANGGKTATIWNPVHNGGLENIQVSRANVGNDSEGLVAVCGAADIFINGVTFQSDHANANTNPNSNIIFENTARSSIVNSNIQNYAGAPRNNIVVMDIGTEDCLVQNNYFVNLYEAVILQGFSNGNVTGYNYGVSTLTGCGSGCNFARAYLSHGTWTHENLEEGDTGDGMLTVADIFWGSSGPRETYFRNEKVNTTTLDQDGVEMGINTQRQGCGGTQTSTTMADHLNMIANVANVVAGRPQCSDLLAQHCGPLDAPIGGCFLTNAWGEKNRFIGSWSRSYGGSFRPDTTWVKSSSDSGFCGPPNEADCQGFFGPAIADPNLSPFPQVLTTSYNGISEPTQWQTFSFPASFYLTSKPAWWCNELPWPAVGADVTTTTSLNKIPAQRRHDGLACTLSGGNPSISIVPGSLSPSANCTGTTPCGTSPSTDNTFQVVNSGGGSLTGSVSTSDATHCPISPTSFSGLSAGQSQTITITYSTSSLNAGTTTNCTFTASATGLASQSIISTITLLTPPAISISPTTLSVSAPQGQNPGNSSITITNTGQSPLTSNITCSSANPTFYGNNSGVNPIITIAQPIPGGAANPVVITYTTTGLLAINSPFSDTITCSATGVSNATLGVTITITAVGTAPTYTVGPFGAGRTLVQGQSTSNLVFQTILTSGGSSQANLSVSSNQTWLVPTADSHGSCSAGVCTTTITATTPIFDRFTATINSAGLSPGTYVATVTAQDAGNNLCLDTSGAVSSCTTQTTTVKLVVQPPPTVNFPGSFNAPFGPIMQNSVASNLSGFNTCNSGFGTLNVTLATSDPLTALSPSTVSGLTNTQCTFVTVQALTGWPFQLPNLYHIIITAQDNSSTPVPLANPGTQREFSGFITPAPFAVTQ